MDKIDFDEIINRFVVTDKFNDLEAIDRLKPSIVDALKYVHGLSNQTTTPELLKSREHCLAECYIDNGYDNGPTHKQIYKAMQLYADQFEQEGEKK